MNLLHGPLGIPGYVLQVYLSATVHGGWCVGKGGMVGGREVTTKYSDCMLVSRMAFQLKISFLECLTTTTTYGCHELSHHSLRITNYVFLMMMMGRLYLSLTLYVYYNWTDRDRVSELLHLVVFYALQLSWLICLCSVAINEVGFVYMMMMKLVWKIWKSVFIFSVI